MSYNNMCIHRSPHCRSYLNDILLTWQNLKQFKYDHTNLLSCMTLDVENCHATVHVKQANLSQAEYCKSSGTTERDGKRDGKTRNQLGSVLSHEQAIMVPHSRECLVAVAGSYRQHVSSRL